MCKLFVPTNLTASAKPSSHCNHSSMDADMGEGEGEGDLVVSRPPGRREDWGKSPAKQLRYRYPLSTKCRSIA